MWRSFACWWVLRCNIQNELIISKKHSIELGNELLELKEHFLNKQI
jgi:hypothetical protein